MTREALSDLPQSVDEQKGKNEQSWEGLRGSRPEVPISTVIPAYNRAHLLPRAIESALRQTLRPIQLIVVDDGSTDNTPEVCLSYGDTLQYVHQANAGVAAARNLGVELVRTPWVAFLDSDDYWTDIHLESVAAAIEATGGRGNFYFADMRLPHEGDEAETLWETIGFALEQPLSFAPNGTEWMLARRQPCALQSSVFNVRRLKACGGFDPRFHIKEDTELFCRLGIAAPVCAVNVVGCVQTADEAQHNRLTGIMHQSSEEYLVHACELWSGLLARYLDLGPGYEQMIRVNLADSLWRLARTYWRNGKVGWGCYAMFRSMRVRPTLLVSLAGRKMSRFGVNP